MKMSTKGRYSLRAVIDIAAHSYGEAVSSRSIAEQAGMSEGYLLQLMRRLKEAGIVRSVRGASGGYALARPASEITVGEIFEAAGEPIEPVECVGLRGRGECQHEEMCRARVAWRRLNDGITEILRGMTIASLFEEADNQGDTREDGQADLSGQCGHNGDKTGSD